MKIVIAIDSFKGCLTSQEANKAATEGVKSVCSDADVVQVPVSDGGEGFLEAFHAAIGGDIQEVVVCDPLMRNITAKYLLKGDTAVIEIAQACGLALLTPEERNPMVATSYGTGQLVADAVRRGAMHVIVGLGGSATSDAGMGMLSALIDTFAKHGNWDDIQELKDVHCVVASDVTNPLCGENGAAHVFAPQKGATADMVLQLDERSKKFAEASALHFGFDRSHELGAGAAGGLGYAFMQYLNAECKSGIQLLLDAVGFRKIAKDADLVITGEGAADRQTLMGKLPMGILQQSGDTPVCLIAGQIKDHEQLLQAGFANVECINPANIALEEAMHPTVAKHHISETVERILTTIDALGCGHADSQAVAQSIQEGIRHICW